MATYYVSSVDGNNADTGADWANAKQTVAGALAVATTTGDVILVDSAHAYTAGAAITWTPSAGIHVSIISTDRTNGGYLAGATESIGAANVAFTIAGAADSTMFLKGLTVNAGTGNNSGADLFLLTAVSGGVEAVECTFTRTATHAGAEIKFGPGMSSATKGPWLWFTGCSFSVSGNTGITGVVPVSNANVSFVGCTWTVANDPASFVVAVDESTFPLRFVGCDLSAFAGTQWVTVTTFVTSPVEFVNCKLDATPALAPAGTWQRVAASVSYVNCDSGDTEYKYAYYTREGALTVDTATYASDSATVAGTALSWKIDTTADADEDSPFVTPWVSTWIDSTGSKTLSLELVYDSASNYDDREIWAEIEYLGNASYPISTVYSSRNANPFTGTGTDLTAGSATWTEALTNDNKDKITTTVTVNGKGLARARLYVAVASTTVYLDPQLRVA